MKKDSGLLYGFSAYIIWGILPLYWKLLGEVGSVDVLFYRIFWSLIFMTLYLIALKNSAIHSRSQRVAKKSAPHHRDYFSRFSDFNQLGCLYLHRLHRPSPASQPRLLHQSVVKCFSRRLLSERTFIKTSQASESGRIDRRRFTNDSNWRLPYQLAAASYELLSLRIN